MRTTLLTLLLLLAGCRPQAPSVLGAGPLEGRSASGRYHLVLEPRPPAPGVGALFTVVTQVQDALTGAAVEGARLSLDATMPAHGHGMVTRPASRELGGGRYLSEGMKLHMHGRWVLVVGIERRGFADEARLPVHLYPGPAP